MVKLLPLLLLFIKAGFCKVAVEPESNETEAVPVLVIFEPEFKFKVDADRLIDPVLAIGTALLPVIVDVEFAVIVPALVTVVPDPQFNVDPVSVMLPVDVFENATGLPLMIVDPDLAIICPELLMLVLPLIFNCDAVNVIIPVLLLVMVPGLLVDMPVAEFDLRLPLLVRVAVEPNAKAPLNTAVHPAPMVRVARPPTDDAPPKVTWLVPAN
ncbi:MAG: hypothetical protein ABIN13_18850 [Mucilaginibacter sp.]